MRGLSPKTIGRALSRFSSARFENASRMKDELEPAEAPLAPSVSSTPPEVTIRISPVRKVSRVYPADGITPLLYKAILRQADTGYPWQLMELYDDVANDPHIGADLRTRKLAVAGAPWELEPGDDSDLGRKIAEEATKFLQRVPGLMQLKCDLLDAPFRGFACIQPIWRAVGARWDVVDWQAIESRFFRFDYGDVPMVETNDSPSGEKLPEGVLFHVVRDKAGPIVRGGFGRAVTKMWLYRGYSIVDAASFLERFGKPHIQVELGPNIKEGSTEFERAKAAALSLIDDQVGLVPPGVKLTVIEAISKASSFRDMYMAFIQWTALESTAAILGHVSASNMGEGSLGHGGEAKQAGEIRQDVKEYDASGLDEVVTSQLLLPWTRYHHGDKAPVPRHKSQVGIPEDEQANADAKKTRAETLQILRPLIALSKSQIRDEFDVAEPEDDEDTIAPQAPPKVVPPGFPPGGAAGAPGEEGEDGTRLTAGALRDGACPHCGGFFSFVEAQKKKRSLLAMSTR